MILALEYLKLLLWTVLRYEFVALRNILWFFKGVNRRLRAARKQGAYKRSAHVRKIVFRFSFDYVLDPASEKQFVTVHDSFQDPDYVLKDNITLFTIDKNEAVFVESDPKQDALNSDHGAFMRMAQFKLAKKIIIVPIRAFHQLADKLPDPSDKVVFANNCARCGSTLLTQVFECTGKALAMSEPDALNALTRLSGQVEPEEQSRIIINAIKALCKPVKGEIKIYILKPTQPSMIATPTLHRLYPSAKHIYMYREGLPAIKSIDKIANALPIFQSVLFFGRLSRSASIFFIRQSGLSADAIGHKVQSRNHFAAIVWASSVRMYLDFLSDGIPIRAVKYEDMVEDPQYAFKQIFDYVGMEFDPEAVTKAFSRDSQRGSPLDMKALSQVALEQITPENQVYIDEACDYFRVPRIPTHYDAPGTITKKPKHNGITANGIQNGEAKKAA